MTLLLEILAGLPPGLIVLVVAALPIVELRGAIPVALALGLDAPEAFAWSIAGNLLPVPVLLWLLEPVGAFLRRGSLRGIFESFERRALARSDLARRYGPAGLALFVAVPLPVTGAWTGALMAVLLGLPPRRAFLAIAVGLLGSATIVGILSLLGFAVLR